MPNRDGTGPAFIQQSEDTTRQKPETYGKGRGDGQGRRCQNGNRNRQLRHRYGSQDGCRFEADATPRSLRQRCRRNRSADQ